MSLATETTIDLTTAARVKLILEYLPSGTGDDTKIAQLITGISKEARMIMGRGVISQSRIERFDVSPGQYRFKVLASPIDTESTITIVNNISTPRDWTVDAIDSDYIICDPDRAERGVILIDRALSAGVDALKITYTGGMAADTAAIIAKYPDIALAIDNQVAFQYQRQVSAGLTAESVGGSSVGYSMPVTWLKESLNTLRSYKMDFV